MTDLSQSKLTTALSRLEEVGAVEVLPTGEVVDEVGYKTLGVGLVTEQGLLEEAG